MSIPDGYKLVPVEPTMPMLNELMRWRECGNVTAWYHILNVAPTPPQPIYDEAAEQEAFEAVNPMPDQVTKFKGGYAPTGYSAWDAQDFCKKWDGWKQCAQSRAKAGEDE